MPTLFYLAVYSCQALVIYKMFLGKTHAYPFEHNISYESAVLYLHSVT